VIPQQLVQQGIGRWRVQAGVGHAEFGHGGAVDFPVAQVRTHHNAGAIGIVVGIDALAYHDFQPVRVIQYGIQVWVLGHYPARPPPGTVHQTVDFPLVQFGEGPAHVFLVDCRFALEAGAHPGAHAFAEAGGGIDGQQARELDHQPDQHKIDAPQQLAQDIMFPRQLAQ
jgi:hypothetical protein